MITAVCPWCGARIATQHGFNGRIECWSCHSRVAIEFVRTEQGYWKVLSAKVEEAQDD